MYINFWNPMIRSEDLGPGKPDKVKVLGLNFAVVRNAAGEAITLSDTCVHRGGLLTGTNSSGATTRPRRSRFHRRVGASSPTPQSGGAAGIEPRARLMTWVAPGAAQ